MSSVREYYEHNTRWFLRFGQEQVIHRALWGPGVADVRAAVHFAHDQLVAELAGVARALDLGCGVGTTSAVVARRLGAEVVGVSISETQVALARAAVAERGPPGVTFEVADFCALPASLGTFGGAFAIEAFAHAPDPAAFFTSVAQRVVPGGVLVVIDDVRAPEVPPDDPVVARFVRGWRVPSVRPVRELSEVAASAGWSLTRDVDFTGYVRTWRPRDRLVHWLQPLIRLGEARDPWLASLVGGDALQVGLSTGRIHHRMLVYRRQDGTPTP